MTLLDEFKEYIRVDGEDETSTLNAFLLAAQVFLKNAGVELPDDLVAKNDDESLMYPLHFLATIVLAAHFYENRQGVSSQAQNVVPFSVQQMILQLKLVKLDESI